MYTINVVYPYHKASICSLSRGMLFKVRKKGKSPPSGADFSINLSYQNLLSVYDVKTLFK